MLFFCSFLYFFFFFFNDTATTEIYTLSLHDALPISCPSSWWNSLAVPLGLCAHRSEEHTSELQSHHDIVCRLLLEKKKNKKKNNTDNTKTKKNTHKKKTHTIQ